ncbi:MAG: HD domain-containing protein [Lactobacillus sp.]|jgi:predicted metal-dependent HD superfamily phosphohydrolase|nr:HD domain-containing protein [Lactobacillus sp.]
MEIKDKIKKIIDDAKAVMDNDKTGGWLKDAHIVVVEEKANWLCDKLPEADRDIVMMGVWLHDIIHFIDLENRDIHAELGAEYARNVMQEEGFSAEVTDKVVEAVRAHSCKDVMPQSLEAKILATADAMSHFAPEYYLGIAMDGAVGKKGIDAYFRWARNKLNKDFNGGKIFFDFAKREVEEDYKKIKAFLDMGDKHE